MSAFFLVLLAIGTGLGLLAIIVALLWFISLFVDDLSELIAILVSILLIGFLCFLFGGILLDATGLVDMSSIGFK
ncbi:hypothetical protein A6E27_23060 [Bacillus cereus]|nr:hypothetical protein A6E27_23060 [Bacillus cereus]